MGEKNLHIVISEQLHERLKIASAKKKMPMKRYASQIIVEGLNQEGL
jgi:predicted HicB family RNase H-like nuclease